MLFLFYLLLVCIVSFFRLGIILSRILTLLIIKNALVKLDPLRNCKWMSYTGAFYFVFN